jgi:hypothetical protein
MAIWRKNAGRRTRLRLRSGGTVMGTAMENLEVEVVNLNHKCGDPHSFH